MVRVSPEQLKALDEWRRLQAEIPSRPEAVRRLMELGLRAKPGHPKVKAATK
jgi:hypothetical protein